MCLFPGGFGGVFIGGGAFKYMIFLFTPRKMVVNKPLVNPGFKYFCLCSFYWLFHDPI